MLSRHSMHPRDVDEMLIWEIAVAVGAHRTDDEDEASTGEPRHAVRARQRAAAIAAGREMPEPEAPSRLEVAQMTQAVSE